MRVIQVIAFDRENIDYEKILWNSPIIMAWQQGADLIVKKASRSFLAIFGDRQIIGRSLDDAVPELRVQGIFGLSRKVFASGVPFIAKEFRVIINQAGIDSVEDRYFNFELQPTKNDQNETDGFLIFGQDVTWFVNSRKLMDLAADELRQAVLYRDEFLSLASHEFKTPLTVLALQETLLEKKFRTPKDDLHVNELFDNAKAQIFKLKNIVDNLIQISEYKTNKLDLHLELFNLVDLSVGVITELNAIFKTGTVKFNCEKKPILVRWDKNKTEQIITNLLYNSKKFGKDSLITVELKEEKDGVSFSIIDRGLGFSKEKIRSVLSKLDEPNFYLSSAPEIGLGLFVVNFLVEAHGGKVKIETKEGEGTKIVIFVPTQRNVGSRSMEIQESR